MPPRTQPHLTNPFLLSLVALAIGLGGPLRVGLAAAQQPSRIPPRALSGQAAVDALGARLPEVAAAHDLTPDVLRELLVRDRTLHLTADSELLYVDTGLARGSATPMPDAWSPAGTLASPESTFFLHSRPGAKHTIYLDFDGHVTQDTRWNGQYDIPIIVSPPFDTDGNPQSFTNAERTLIQQVFDGVAEDYLPFDVDVTTQDPGLEALRRWGAGDLAWGIRVVFTADFTGGSCECGGMAYLGFFSANTDTPVFVFTRTSLADIIHSASHEVGHSMKLNHDGAGAQEYYSGHGVADGTSWAPIMGGSYQRLVTQWSKGGYYAATNLEDDLAIITTQNGFGYRPDDHAGNSIEATSLTVVDAGAGNLVASGSGIISESGDEDFFTFVSGAGSINLTLRSDPPSPRYDSVHHPNLNVDARLYDSNGMLLGNARGVQTVTLSKTVPGGRYFLAVTGTGTGTPFIPPPTGYSRYGSLGSYDIAGTFPSTPCPVVQDVDPLISPIGSTVTITGTNLTWVRAVTFSGGAGALFTVETPTRITATIPAGAVNGPLTLSNDPRCPSVATKPVTICTGTDPIPDGEGGDAGPCISVVAVDDPRTERLAFGITPNPMVQESTIRFALPQAGVSTVRILDPAGRLVRRLHGGWTPAGPQQLRWDGRDQDGARADAGVYFVVVDGAGGVRERGKLVILR